MKYFVATPWWLKMMYPRRLWRVGTKEKRIYLTFDDGPHPVATPFVLDQLKKYDAKATFFCIGKNVVRYPGIYQRMLDEGHQAGNHTNDHLNGWKTGDSLYLENVAMAAQQVSSSLFRPPYGKLRSSQARGLSTVLNTGKPVIVMWDILSGDFDTGIDGETCFNNVTRHHQKGSIIVFHDSEKALPRLEYALPEVLDFFSKRGYKFHTL